MAFSRWIINFSKSLIIPQSRRNISLSAPCCIKEIRKTEDGNTLIIEGAYVPQPREDMLIERNDETTCALCSAGVDVKHTDVLIIKQFLRSNGTVLPRRITGLCKKQQKQIEVLALMAHKAGLLKPANKRKRILPFLRQEYKNFNTYYDEDTIGQKKPSKRPV